MRAWLLVCAALALAPCRATAAHQLDAARLERIKSQILAKLGLSTRPTPLGAPPRDVVRQILARAADPLSHDEHQHDDEHAHAMREVIAIAHRDKCSIACHGSPASQPFASGQSYNYGVEGFVNIYLSGTDRKETGVKILGQVSVSSIGNCGHQLRVLNLAISGPDGKKYQSPPGIEKPIQFSLQDGRLGPEICAQDGDSRRSLNIKRAIISLLQTETKSNTQYDIFGACPTDVSSSQEGASVLVHRSRDLTRCAHREQSSSDLVSSVFNPSAEIKESQILQSSLRVESKVNNGVPEKVYAEEEYLYRPFSVGENGARARVGTKLTLTGKGPGGVSIPCSVSRTIIFENPHGDSVVPNNVNSALAAVKETAQSIGSEANEKSAGNFAQLVRILRSTTKDDLIKVFGQVKGVSLERRVFIDALIRAGTGPSIEAAIIIMKGNNLDVLEQQLVLLSLGNAKHVDDGALKAATSLLDASVILKELYLGVGALAGAYCRQHQCHSTRSEGITLLSQKLAVKLQNCKPKNKLEEDSVVAVLKGIRNIRHLEDSLIDRLVQCASDTSIKARVRAAALEAFFADPCSAKIKKTALDLMKNRQLDSEIRIKGYLAVIACPCGNSANEIKILLDSEPVHQVGRFISSSLRAIRASTNPDKQLARQHYGQISTPSRFNVDDRKYSFFREQSFNIDALGIGGSIDQSVIYSQDSFLPRSAAFNLTTEVFGHSFNLLEFGGRQGNLDLVIEHFLGPKGILKRQGAAAIFNIMSQAYVSYNDKVRNAINRQRRAIKNEVDAFDKTLKDESIPFDYELDLDIYLKLFGTDAIFLSLGNDKPFDFDNAVNELIAFLVNTVDRSKHLSHELRSHLLFIDAELSYPTSTGLPLRLDVTGSATARIDLNSDFDLRECVHNPQNAKMDIKFIPSSDIEIAGTLLVDADSVSTGLKVIANLHSSTGIHVNAKVLENGGGFDLQLGLPVDKQEIVVASSDIVLFTAEKGQKEKQTKISSDNNRKEYSECFDQLSGVLGLTLCGEVSMSVNPEEFGTQASIAKYLARYPVSGFNKLKVVLEKNDLKGYHIRGLIRNDPGKSSFELLFDAEGSKNRRTQIIGERIFTNDEVGLKLALESPIKVLSAEIHSVITNSEFAAFVRAKMDAEEYYGKVGFNVQGNERRTIFKPIFEYQFPDGEGKRSVNIDGQIIREINGPIVKLTLDGIKIKLPSSQDPMAIDGFLSSQRNPKYVEWQLISEYATIKGNLKSNDLELEFMNKLNPLVNFKLIGHSEFGSEVVKNEIDIIYSNDLKDKSKRFIFGQYLKSNYENGGNFNIITKNRIEIVSLPFKVRFDVDVDPKKIESDFEWKSPDQSALVELRARNNIKRPEDYSFKLSIAANQRQVEIFSKRDIISPDKSNFENYVSIKGVARYELSGVVQHRYQTRDYEIGATGHLKISGSQNEEFKFSIGATSNPTTYGSHAQIASSKSEILDYVFKINYGPNASGELRFILKDAIAAGGEFKVNNNDGKGNGMIIIDFKQSQRKVKVDLKFTAKNPVFNADFDILLNYEKDNNDKICFTTNNQFTDPHIESKNKLEYGGKSTELNILEDGIYSGSGKARVNVEVVLPTERCLTFKFDRDVSVNNDVMNGNAEVLLSDAPKRGAGASIIRYKGKVVNTNFEKSIVDYQGDIELQLKEGKQLHNVFSFKNQPVGEKFKFEFKSDVNGNLIPHPASAVATITYVDSLESSDDNYLMKAQYGDDMSVEFGGVFEVKLDDSADQKYIDDFWVTARLPVEKARNIKWISTVIYLQPKNNDILEFTMIESLQLNSDVYKIDSNGKLGFDEGSGTVKLLVPQVDPFVMDVNYKNDKNSNRLTNFAEVKMKYGKGSTMSYSAESVSSPNGNDLAIKASAPQNDKWKKFELAVHSKNPAPDAYSASWLVDVDGRVYKTDSNIVLSKAHPVLDLQYSGAGSSKPSKIYIKGSSLSSTQGKIEGKIENIGDLSLDFTSEAIVQKDNINAKFQANSEKLGWKNVVGQIISKDKKLEFHYTNDGRNVLSGSTSYIYNQDGAKTIIEGSGSMKINEEQKSTNFKYIRTVLTEGNEKGVETFFNVAFGDRSYVAESRITNLEYKNSHVYCEEKKQCAHAELQSKIDLSKPGVIANVVNAGFDLRKLGVAPELGLVIRDEVSSTQLPQYTLDLHANKDDRKYHVHVYSTPVYGQSKSGIVIQIPQRIIAFENSVSYPNDKILPFPIKGEMVMDWDRTKSGHRAAARFLVDLNIDNDQKQTAVAEFAFSHPKIDKEALIRVSGAAIRSGENSIKIETTAVASHACLGRDREAKILFEASPNHLKFFINTPLVKVIDIEGSATVQDKLQKADFKFVLLENKPVQVNAMIRDYQYYEFTTGYIAEADRKLSIVGRIEPEKRVDISADILLSGQKKNIAHGALWLDNNLVKSDYGVSRDNVEYFLNALRKDLVDLNARVKELGQKASGDLQEISSRVEGYRKVLSESYEGEIKKLSEELSEDKVLQQMGDAVTITALTVFSMMDQVGQATRPIVERLYEVYADFVKQISELYSKQLAPQIEQLYNAVAMIIEEFFEGLLELVAHVAAMVSDFFEKHKAEFQELINTIAEIFKDLTRLVVAHLREYREEVENIVSVFGEWFRDVFELAKEKWSELGVPEQVVELVQQALGTLRPLLPTPEAQQFADALSAYVCKKLRKEKSEDSKELRELYQLFANAVGSVVQFLRVQFGNVGVPVIPSFEDLMFSPSGISSFPSFGGEAAISFLRQIINGDFPSIASLIKAYRPRSLNPLDEIPAKLRAVVVNGQHIFTFDGRHLTFPGTCRYVLAHDYVDRNFTLLLQLQQGSPKALILQDKAGNVVEMKDNGQVAYNGMNRGFPVDEKDTFAFRQPNGRIGLGTNYGLLAICTSKLEVCYIEVNGFYLGKLRGLLGDGNNEPYDDFRLPNGKMCTSESEFGNAYRLTRSCPQVTSPEHSHHQMHGPLPKDCEKVFGGYFKALGHVMDIAPFRQACVHAVAADAGHGEQQACELARGAAALAVGGLLPALVPRHCLRCSDVRADRPAEIGDTYDVKLPAAQADIVVMVETTKTSEKAYREIVVPLVSQLVDTLKSRRIADVKVYLIGITARMPYPILYDSDLKLKGARITFPDYSRYDDFWQPFRTGSPFSDDVFYKLINLGNALKNIFGLTNVQVAYSSLLDLNVRPTAVKHYINLIGDSCIADDIITNAIRGHINKELMDQLAATRSMITVTDHLSVGNGMSPDSIVGFNDRYVLMLGDKKPTKESEALQRTIEYVGNGCIEHAENAGGLVFSLSNFNKMAPVNQKLFVQTAANAIVQEMLADNIEQSCLCTYADAFRARSVCVTEDRKPAARRR